MITPLKHRSMLPKIVPALSLCFLGLFAYLFIFSILFPRYTQYNNTMLLDGACAILLLVGLARFFRSKQATKLADLVQQKRVIIPIFIVLFSLSCLVAFSLAIDPSQSGWDPLTIFQAARNLATGHATFTVPSLYFQAYPNNFGVLGILVVWLKFFGHFGIHDYFGLTLLLNLLFLNAGFIVMYLTAQKLCGPRTSLLVLLLGFVFITLSPWSRTYYSDTLGLLFPIAEIYLLLIIKQAGSYRRRLMLIIVLGLVGGLGYAIKPTTVFILVAAVIVYGLAFTPRLRSLRQKPLFKFGLVCGFVVSFAVVALGIKLVMSQELHITGPSMPLSSFMMMGLSKTCTSTNCRYGAWNLPDALKLNDFATMQQYNHYSLQQIPHRLNSYGVGGYSLFLSEKGAWIIGDGTFYTYQEGLEATAAPLHKQPLNRFLQAFLRPGSHGYTVYQNVVQVFWISVSLCILVPFVRRRHSLSVDIQVIHIALLGLLSFLLLFEARSRYLYLYVPVFIVLANYGFSLLITPAKSTTRQQ